MNDRSPDARFPKELRLLSSPEFRRVFERNRSVADDVLIVYGAPNHTDIIRLGLADSRKAGNAVVRNQWKRQIREAFRQQAYKLPKGIDLVVLPRRGAVPEHHDVCDSLAKLVKKLARRLESRTDQEC
jgi:ribonuclease P protein component